MLYRDDDQSINENVMGIRLRDYQFSEDVSGYYPMTKRDCHLLALGIG